MSESFEEGIEMPGIPKETARKMARLEEEFNRVELDQLRASVPLLRPLYEKRNALITRPDVEAEFWIRVFSNAPAEIDEYILPSDAAILSTCLKNLTIERFEVDDKGQGEPRSLRLTFEFRTDEENAFITDAKVVKDFYWRQQVTKNAQGKRRFWEGLVSEPVRINWKKGMDPTKGLLDAACDLAEAEKKQQQKKKGADRTTLPEFEKLVRKVAELEAAANEDEDEEDDEDPMAGNSPAGVSFFALFGYRGRDVSAEQSKEAEKDEEERWAKIAKGEEPEDEDEDDDDDEEDEDVDSLEDIEIFPDGEDVATAIAEDLWPNALKYYVESYAIADDLSDADLEDLEDLEGDEDDEEEESHPRKKTKV
ncbi:hypothetical protein ASPZODRAFT_129315 [Penicilliopsis zonata CBS 506.65]|uniref:BSD domain-containing protein n=1 Tax=Penicilliopsis zonata CBS 506.65 TaxID=1073090 RepID=A0A1L9SP40_9EURO|nr:hypothetical protein ASPZODRAFT_129315 [Penicilliopsis zonata CBS 506.65]OJJ48968.1 hypothetical protein ASPZODRAFT_129315 [Penicilliopsis zonata CBS 506.65]